MHIMICKTPFQMNISSMNKTVDPGELCKETMCWMIISTFPCLILSLPFAFFGISYHLIICFIGKQKMLTAVLLAGVSAESSFY